MATKKQQPIEKPVFLTYADAMFGFIAKVGFYVFLLAVIAIFLTHRFYPDALVYALSVGIISAFLYILINLVHGLMTQAFEMTLDARVKQHPQPKNDTEKKDPKKKKSGGESVPV